MSYTGYVTTLKNVRPHSNADRLLMGECFGNNVVVSLDYYEGQRGVYFPVDGKLSAEFAEANNLVRKKDAEGKNIGGYLDPDKRNITAIKLRGEKSDGLFLPLKCLETFGDISTLNDGDRIDTFNGHLICEKYIPRRNHSTHATGNGKKKYKNTVNIAPTFAEHVDTEQLNYNLDAFKPGDDIEITLKLHGTSHRVGYLPVLKGYNDSWACRVGNAFRHMLNNFGCHYEDKHDGKPYYKYDYVAGTRRVVLENYEGGYYGDNHFREPHSKFFEGKLWKGETVYMEIVGFTDTGTPIMPPCANSKLNDEDFVKKYGETTVFSYGCEACGYEREIWNNEEKMRPVPQSDIYVYRMTMTNQDGDVVEYTPDFMRYRCEQMGVKTAPVMWRGRLEEPDDWTGEEWNAGLMAKAIAEWYYEGPDPIGKTHVREGVVVRILNRPKFEAYKTKNFEFKCLEGLVKAEADAPDMEEAQDSVE